MQHRPATPEGAEPGEMVELRVHGVGGATPEELLDVPLTRRVAGDPAAGFFRPWRDEERTPTSEGYSWGGLTSASRLRALWVLLTPFALVNLAGWMIRHGGEASDHARRSRDALESVAAGLVRLFGVVVTVGVAGYVSTGAIDLIASQCGTRPTCASGRWWLSVFDNRLVDGRPGAALAVGAVAAAVVIGGVAWIARRSQQAIHPGTEGVGFGFDGRDDPAFELNLSTRSLWTSPHVAHRLGLTHLAAGMTAVAISLAHVTARLGLSDADAVAAAGWVVLGAVVLAALRIDGVPAVVHTGLAIAAGVLLAAALAAAWGSEIDSVASPGPVPGGRVVTEVVVAVVPAAALVAGLAIVALWRRQRTTPLRVAGVAPALLLAGSGMVDAFGSGMLIRLADLLGTPVVESDYPPDQPLTDPPIVYGDLVGDVAVITVVAVAALVVAGLAVWLRAGDGPDCETLAERFADRGGLDCADHGDRMWAREVGRAEAMASITDRAPAVVGWVTGVLVVAVAAAVWTGDDGAGLRLGPWADRLAGPASVVLGLVPLFAVVGIARLYRSRAVRRVVGVLWDVATFWPRWFHPWSPPAYGERAVPQLGDRLTVLTSEGRVVVSAHSQGSVVAFAALMSAGERVTARTALLTHGSPLARLYARYFPEYAASSAFGDLADQVRGWVNLWRVTDYIGGVVAAPGVDDVAVVDPPSTRPPALGEARPVALRHGDFEHTPEYEAALGRLMSRLALTPDPGCAVGWRLMHRRLRSSSLASVFEEIRREEAVPESFPLPVLEEAEAAATRPLPDRADLRHLPFVTIDPPGSTDLDQAMALADRSGGGIRLHYAIADVAAFVTPGGEIDEAAHRRGVTVYCPDRHIPLHPPVLSSGAASLLPETERPAIVWEIDVDADGEPQRSHVQRALVRSRGRYTYDEVQGRVDAGNPPEPLAALPRFGTARLARGVERGALTLRLPEQEVVARDGSWHLEARTELAAERWNAEVSLLTGMTAAAMMLDAGVGIVRTLPAPAAEVMEELRAALAALGVSWEADRSPSAVLAGLDPARPRHLAAFEEATRLLRGAGYLSFLDGAPGGDVGHAGVAAPYAHVTAPIRRLADRAALEACVAVAGGTPVPEWVVADLETLAAVMEDRSRSASTVERRCVDAVEAWLLSTRIGDTFEAIVLECRSDGAEVWLEEPAVLVWAAGLRADQGTTVIVRVADADVAAGRVVLERASN